MHAQTISLRGYRPLHDFSFPLALSFACQVGVYHFPILRHPIFSSRRSTLSRLNSLVVSLSQSFAPSHTYPTLYMYSMWQATDDPRCETLPHPRCEVTTTGTTSASVSQQQHTTRLTRNFTSDPRNAPVSARPHQKDPLLQRMLPSLFVLTETYIRTCPHLSSSNLSTFTLSFAASFTSNLNKEQRSPHFKL